MPEYNYQTISASMCTLVHPSHVHFTLLLCTSIWNACRHRDAMTPEIHHGPHVSVQKKRETVVSCQEVTAVLLGRRCHHHAAHWGHGSQNASECCQNTLQPVGPPPGWVGVERSEVWLQSPRFASIRRPICRIDNNNSALDKISLMMYSASATLQNISSLC